MGSLFGNAPTISTSGTQPFLNGLQSLAPLWSGNAASQESLYNQAQPKAQAAINQESQFLTAAPGTQQEVAEGTANAEQNANLSANSARSNFNTEMAERGIAPGSSADTGGLAAIDSNQANSDAAIQAQEGEANTSRYQAGLGENANLLSGNANSLYGNYANSLTNAANVNSTGFNEADTQAMQQYAAAQAANQQNAALWGQAAPMILAGLGAAGVGGAGLSAGMTAAAGA